MSYRIPPMPAVNRPRTARPTNCYGQVIDGYVESFEDQARNNRDAIAWFLQHHEAIAEAVRLHNAVHDVR
jgi:hypothetical protein